VRAERLGGLRFLLPPRPGGFSALVDVLPNADIVVIAHRGLDRYLTFKSLIAAVPLPDPIEVTAWRIAAPDIPTDPTQRTVWLDQEWQKVDEWVGSAGAS
jgi:hypothetical protein